MRRPHRNIEIFSMSVLDMFASALGAFIMIAVILFPSYNKDVAPQLEVARKELSEKRAQRRLGDDLVAARREAVRLNEPLVRQAQLVQASLVQCRRGVEACMAEAKKTFLMVQAEWTSSHDVNLHVTDPDGNEFSWARTNRTGRDFPGTKAQLSTDVAIGPGIEVWLSPEAKPGAYRIEYVLVRPADSDAAVSGLVFDKFGSRPLPPRTIPRGQVRVLAATAQIAGDGTMTLR